MGFDLANSFWKDIWIWFLPLCVKFSRPFSIPYQQDCYVSEVEVCVNEILTTNI